MFQIVVRRTEKRVKQMQRGPRAHKIWTQKTNHKYHCHMSTFLISYRVRRDSVDRHSAKFYWNMDFAWFSCTGWVIERKSERNVKMSPFARDFRNEFKNHLKGIFVGRHRGEKYAIIFEHEKYCTNVEWLNKSYSVCVCTFFMLRFYSVIRAKIEFSNRGNAHTAGTRILCACIDYFNWHYNIYCNVFEWLVLHLCTKTELQNSRMITARYIATLIGRNYCFFFSLWLKIDLYLRSKHTVDICFTTQHKCTYVWLVLSAHFFLNVHSFVVQALQKKK